MNINIYLKPKVKNGLYYLLSKDSPINKWIRYGARYKLLLANSSSIYIDYYATGELSDEVHSIASESLEFNPGSQLYARVGSFSHSTLIYQCSLIDKLLINLHKMKIPFYLTAENDHSNEDIVIGFNQSRNKSIINYSFINKN